MSWSSWKTKHPNCGLNFWPEHPGDTVLNAGAKDVEARGNEDALLDKSPSGEQLKWFVKPQPERWGSPARSRLPSGFRTTHPALHRAAYNLKNQGCFPSCSTELQDHCTDA